MKYDIQSKTAEAQLAYETALNNLEVARSDYDQGPKAALAAAMEQTEKLMAKIEGFRTTASVAEEDFKEAFEAAGYERTTTVRQALSRKNDALAMAEELEIALANLRSQNNNMLLDAIPKAQVLRSAYQSAKGSYGLWKAYEAMGAPADDLKRAIALAAHTISYGSDSLGRSAFSSADAKEGLRRGLAFIWEGLLQMAFENQEHSVLPFAPVDISPLKSSDLLSPLQLKIARLAEVAG